MTSLVSGKQPLRIEVVGGGGGGGGAGGGAVGECSSGIGIG